MRSSFTSRLGSFLRPTFVVQLLVLYALVSASSDTLRVDRIGLRLSYLSQHERIVRRSVSAEDGDFSSAGVESVAAEATDNLVASVGCIDQASGEAAFPQQAFLRFVRTDTGADSVYVLRPKSIESRLELTLKTEIHADKKFWAHDVSYRVEIIVGDVGMEKGVKWLAVESLTFGDSSAKSFASSSRGVFDFDVSVKKVLLPEFSSPLPPPEKEAPFMASLIATIAILAPLPLVFVAWGQLGVFPLSLPENASEKTAVIGFELCLVGHMATLTMFWLRWNIIFTWKVMGALMAPTAFFAYRFLSPAASRHVGKKAKKAQ